MSLAYECLLAPIASFRDDPGQADVVSEQPVEYGSESDVLLLSLAPRIVAILVKD